MERTGRNLDIKFFATDVDSDAIVLAGNGTYPESIAADVSPHYLSRYFVRRDDYFQICRSIREMVVFAQHNLIKDPPFTHIDLISCRNLLIYFQPVLQRKVLDFFDFSFEELMASNQELQSTNQELQSVNEELHTVNAEHQRKIMESTELNNDMRNFMEGTDVGIMFLDENLELRKFTPRITRIFDAAENDIGRSLIHLPHCLDGVDPLVAL